MDLTETVNHFSLKANSGRVTNEPKKKQMAGNEHEAVHYGNYTHAIFTSGGRGGFLKRSERKERKTLWWI